MLLTLVTVALVGMVGINWRIRVRAARRWLTAVESYADREIARELAVVQAARRQDAQASRLNHGLVVRGEEV